MLCGIPLVTDKIPNLPVRCHVIQLSETESVIKIKKGQGQHMNISITGNLGSGKSSVAKILQEKGYQS